MRLIPIPLAAILPAVLLVPTGLAAQADSVGRSAEDLRWESFLATAAIVGDEPVGTGITEPRKLTLEAGGVRRHAIFKDVDVEVSEVARTNRFEMNFTDRYVYEVAAYRLDRYLRLGLVPVTVLREIDGHEGSVQLWVEDVIQLSKGVEENREVRDFDLLLQRLTLTWVFDALILNIDRNHDNILVDLDEDRFFLIDHSRAFRLTKRIPAFEGQGVVLPEEVATHLRALDHDVLETLLGNLVSHEQIKAIDKRLERLLSELRERHLLPAT